MSSFVFLSSRFLLPLDQEHPLDPLVKGSCPRPETLEFSDLDYIATGHYMLRHLLAAAWRLRSDQPGRSAQFQ